METEGLLAFGTGDKGDKGGMQVEMGEPRQAGWRTVEVPVTLVLPASFAAGTAGGETDLVLSVGALDRFGARSELPQIHFKASPSEGAQIRSEVTVRLRKAEQRLVFHVRDPLTGNQLVEEVSYPPGK